MRRIACVLMVVGLVVGLVVGSVAAWDIPVNLEIPNAEVSQLYSMKSGDMITAVTSKFLRVSILDGRLGHQEGTKKLVGALGFDLKELEKIGADVTYVWSDILKASFSCWGGYDFNPELEDKWDGGWMMTFQVVALKK